MREEPGIGGTGRVDPIAVGVEDRIAVAIEEGSEARSDDRAGM
jgi:hypothetical protein